MIDWMFMGFPSFEREWAHDAGRRTSPTYAEQGRYSA
jgi:hypothetical protein